MTKQAAQQSARMAAVLARMRQLLEAYGEHSWADAVGDFAARQATEDVRAEIRRQYGGMGSFNDIVLHSADSARMKTDNTEFDALRAELFELCR